MKKHKHKFQFARIRKIMPRYKEKATFICECGATKDIQLFQETEDNSQKISNKRPIKKWGRTYCETSQKRDSEGKE